MKIDTTLKVNRVTDFPCLAKFEEDGDIKVNIFFDYSTSICVKNTFNDGTVLGELKKYGDEGGWYSLDTFERIEGSTEIHFKLREPLLSE
jgi:hypothetical protein